MSLCWPQNTAELFKKARKMERAVESLTALLQAAEKDLAYIEEVRGLWPEVCNVFMQQALGLSEAFREARAATSRITRACRA